MSIVTAIADVRRASKIGARFKDYDAQTQRISDELFYRSPINDILFDESIAVQAIKNPQEFITQRSGELVKASNEIHDTVDGYVKALSNKGLPPRYIERLAKLKMEQEILEKELVIGKLFPINSLSAADVVDSYLGNPVAPIQAAGRRISSRTTAKAEKVGA